MNNAFYKVSITGIVSTLLLIGVFIGSTGFQTDDPKNETVTFLYNGTSVTYGIITSNVTGRQWLDRNLGADTIATSLNDFRAYGDLFQWGRPADGHQVLSHKSANETAPVNNATTSVISDATSPGHANFITVNTQLEGSRDWIDPSNPELWTGDSSVNSPCPNGWKVPSIEDWLAEGLTGDSQQAYDRLRITSTGFRDPSGAFSNVGIIGAYWTSSTTGADSVGTIPYSVGYAFWNNPMEETYQPKVRSFAFAVRCIKAD